MPSLTCIGSTRMQIAAVRISKKYRGKHFGEWMMSIAMKYGKSKGVSIVQLTTNKNVQEPNSSMKDLVLKQHMKE